MLVIKDFATTTLASALTAVSASIVVSDAGRLPTLLAGDYFYLVLQKFTDRSFVEIVKVTGVAANTLTVVRAQAGTTAKAFGVGDYAEVRLTVATFDEYLAQLVVTKVDETDGFVNQRLDLLNAADLVKAGVGVVYDATNGHGTILSGGEGANKRTPYVALRPLGMADESVQAKYLQDGSLILTGGSRYVETGLLSMKHAADSNGWPVTTVNDPNNFANRAKGKIHVGNNALYFIADAGFNVRRFGIQSGHEHPGYTTTYGILDLNPFGGAVRANGGVVYHTNYVPTPAAVGALALSGGILTGILDQNIGGYGGRVTAAGGYAYLQGGKVGGDTSDQKLKITGISATALTEFEIVTAGHGVAKVNGARIYTEQYVPTPDILGAVPQARTINSKPLTSDVVLAPDDVGALSGKTAIVEFNQPAGVWMRIARVRMPQSTSTIRMTFYGGSGYHAGATVHANKVDIVLRACNNSPNGVQAVAYRNFQSGALFSELGYVAVGGDDYDIYVKSVGNFGLRVLAEYGWASGAIVDYSFIAATTTSPSGFVAGSVYDFYNTGFKPTAADVSAVPLAGAAVVANYLSIQGHSSTGAITVKRSGLSQFSSFGQTADGAAIIGNTLTQDGAVYTAYLKAGAASLQYSNGVVATNIFHEGFVPTAAAVGAAPVGFGLGVPALQKTAQDQTQAGFWRDVAINMAGITLPYDGAPSQAFLGVNTTSKKLMFGHRTGATSVPISWFEVYSGNNKPTPAALGAVPASQLLPVNGGTMNWADLVGKVPVINSAGLTELGRYLDMREQDSDADFNWRFDAGASGAGKLTLYNAASAPVFEFAGTGRCKVLSNGLDVGGRLQVAAATNPMYEWHVPGKYAAAAYLTATNEWRFVGSNGLGGETSYRFVSFADGNFIARGAVLSDFSTGSTWNSYNTAAFRVGTVRPMTNGSYCKLISHRMLSPGTFDLENSLGAFADGAGWDMLCHTLVSTDGGGIASIWKFRNNGDMYGPSGNAFAKDGNIWGGVFGGSSVTAWATARFAPISDIRYKTNIRECEGSALDVIAQLHFYSYEWDSSKKLVAGRRPVRYGVSAQDVELIDEAYVKDAEVHEVHGGEPTIIKTLDNGNLLTLALKAIQELSARVAALEGR